MISDSSSKVLPDEPQPISSQADQIQLKPFDYWPRMLPIFAIVLGYILILVQHLAPKVGISNLDYFPLVERGLRLSVASLSDWVNWQHPVGFPWLVRIGLMLGLDSARWGQALSVLGGSLGLVGAYLIAWRTSGSHRIGLVCELFTALTSYYLYFGGFEGNDMLAAGLQILALGAFLAGWGASTDDGASRIRWILLAGVTIGLAYLTRYTGMITAGVIILCLGLSAIRHHNRSAFKALGAFLAAFLIVTALQWIPTWIVTGAPLSNDQGPNVWFHVLNKHDYLTEWNQIPANITVAQVFLLNPARFITHWWGVFSSFWLSPDWMIVGIPLKIFGQAGLVLLVLLGTTVRKGVRLLLGMFVFFHLAALSLMRLDPRFLIILIPILALGAVMLFARILPSRWGWRRWRLPVQAMAVIAGVLIAIPVPLSYITNQEITPTAIIEASDALHAAGMHTAQEVLSTNLHLQDLEDLNRSRFALANDLNLPHDTLDQLLEAARAKHIRFLIYDANTGPKLYPALTDLLVPESHPGSLTPIYIEPNRAFVIYRIESQPSVGNQLSATFDQGISLLQYDVSVNKPVTETADSRDIGVFLDWRAQQPLTVSYKVFVHISDMAGNIVAQDDSLPRLWTYPTTDWKAGERVADFHRIRLKVTPGAVYQIAIGLYDVDTTNRLNLLDATGAVTADQFILQTISFP